MKPFHALAGLLASAICAGAAHAQLFDLKPEQVKYLAANCANCHGTHGRAPGAGLPSLAGLSASYITEQMKEFKAGTRPATLMHQIAKGYTDEQIAAMAQFFASQK